MKKILVVAALFSSLCSFAQFAKVSSGKLDRYENFKSEYIQARNVEVWLPEDYSPSKKYAVLYMHDGQMLYDAKVTWNKQEWRVDEIASQLQKEGKVRDFIVVGIWNNGQYRYTDYFPEKALGEISKKKRYEIKSSMMGKPLADEYLLFITKEVKPFIDRSYSTRKNKANTFVAGSSMGGLISMYAICEYPDIFGGAICMSTHWPGSMEVESHQIADAFVLYLKKNLPSSADHKIYFDYGTLTIDQYYKIHQLKVDKVMKEVGYDKSNWLTKEFAGDDHSEKSWANRLHIPFEFMLKK